MVRGSSGWVGHYGRRASRLVQQALRTKGRERTTAWQFQANCEQVRAFQAGELVREVCDEHDSVENVAVETGCMRALNKKADVSAMGLHPYWNYLIEKMISEDKQFTAKK